MLNSFLKGGIKLNFKRLFCLSVLVLMLSSCATYTPTTYSVPTTTSYHASYNLSLSKVERPEKATLRYGEQKIDTITDDKYSFVFEDDLVRILWLVNSRAIGFLIYNKTDHSIKIPWDEAAFIDEKRGSHRVMHSGVKYTDRSNPQAPSLVARKASLNDIVFPTDYVSWSKGSRYTSGNWKEKSFFPDYDFHGKYITGNFPTFTAFEDAVKSKIGKSIQVLLPLQIEDVINDYIFTFIVDDVSCSMK